MCHVGPPWRGRRWLCAYAIKTPQSSFSSISASSTGDLDELSQTACAGLCLELPSTPVVHGLRGRPCTPSPAAFSKDRTSSAPRRAAWLWPLIRLAQRVASVVVSPPALPPTIPHVAPDSCAIERTACSVAPFASTPVRNHSSHSSTISMASSLSRCSVGVKLS